MKTGKTSHKKLNNQGFTLVELLVAIIVLSIAVIGLYRGFVLSAQTNAKARNRHKATTLAQNIMEGMKAVGGSGALAQFKEPMKAQADGSTIRVFDILTPNQLANARNVTYTDNGNGNYTFTIPGITADGTAFEAKVTMNGSGYKDSKNAMGALVPATSGQNFNSEGTIQIPGMDLNHDGVTAASKVYGTRAVSEIKASMLATNFNESLMSRIITITTSRKPVISGGYLEVVTATYSYMYNGREAQTYKDVIFNNSDNTNQYMRNLFLFFQPAYGWAHDDIVIDNRAGIQADMYIVKQLPNADYTGNLAQQDYNHNLKVDIKDTVTNGKGALNIHTNLLDNLDRTNAAYANMINTKVLVNNYPKTKNDLLEITQSESKDVLYDVTVEVWLSKDPEQKVEMTGSVRN